MMILTNLPLLHLLSSRVPSSGFYSALPVAYPIFCGIPSPRYSDRQLHDRGDPFRGAGTSC